MGRLDEFLDELEDQNRALVEALKELKPIIDNYSDYWDSDTGTMSINPILKAKDIINNTFSQLPADTLKRYESEKEVLRIAINFVHCQGDGLNDLRKAVEALEGLA